MRGGTLAIRALAVAALAIPVSAGLAYLHAFGAPRGYLLVNAGALVVAGAVIAFAPAAPGPRLRRAMILAALILLYLPLAFGPAISGVTRWVPVGPFPLHTGMIAIPVIAVLVGEEPDYAPAILSAALLAALLQPDMASAAALLLAAFGLYDASRDWRYGAFAAVAFPAALVAAVRGELPARPFADHVIWLLARTEPLAALGLLAALLASFVLMIASLPGTERSRKALGGALVGFSFAGLVSNYPSALVGYGAAPILGFGIATALLGRPSGTAGRAGDYR